MPIAAQIWRYIGTIAAQKPSMPTTMTRSFPISWRLRWAISAGSALISGVTHELEEHDGIDPDGHRREHDAGQERVAPLLVHAFLAPRAFACAYFTTGAISNVWYGTGVGRCVHSSESAPSQGFSGEGTPLRMQLTML